MLSSKTLHTLNVEVLKLLKLCSISLAGSVEYCTRSCGIGKGCMAFLGFGSKRRMRRVCNMLHALIMKGFIIIELRFNIPREEVTTHFNLMLNGEGVHRMVEKKTFVMFIWCIHSFMSLQTRLLNIQRMAY